MTTTSRFSGVPLLARSRAMVWPWTFAALMVLALFVVPPVFGRSVDVFSVYNGLQSFAGVGLVALALGLTMIAGELDLSVVGTYALGGMIAVKVGATNPFIGLLVAVIACTALGAVQGIVVAKFGINSMAVTLGGYLTALGLTGIIGHDRSQAYLNFGISDQLNRPVLTIFSVRSLVVLGVFLIVALAFSRTSVGRDLRAIGGGRRASRTAGVRVDGLLIATFAASGLLSALGGVLQSYGVATASSSPGLTPLIFGVTASLLGGVALAGGRGSPFGIVAGALGLSFFGELFITLASPQYLVSLITGALLIAVTVVATPVLLRLARRRRPSFARRTPSSNPALVPGA